MTLTWLQLIWFVLVGVLWTGYLVLEGFGVGSGMVMHLVAKNDAERTQVQRTFGPVWDGNQVWLLTAGGATFAAFPNWYATMFSGMYFALFVILLCLIVRICAIEWRSKVASTQWRARWDKLQTGATILVPILFGCAFGNLVQGMRIEVVERANQTQAVPVTDSMTAADINMATSVHYLTGTGGLADNGFLSLLTPFTILGGIMLALVFATQGLLWLRVRTDGPVHDRAARLVKPFGLAATVVTAVFALWGQFAYSTQVLAWIPLVICALSLIASVAMSHSGRAFGAFLAHSVAIAFAVAWVFSSMAPYAMKSSIHPAYSLSLPQAAATGSTLTLMLCVSVVMVPVVLAYTAWSYSRMPMIVELDKLGPNAGLPWKRIREGATFLSA
ncbi:cytochrome d ubiquinol oxidase subunit II [Nanchangia anserum]|uniref:Cytochrome d ubiquinol oxidase subunit II n=1 Tax=Nanchangia anserum TaxID=2692125 RepID=A0A8I0GHR8_9ACTO|nr:cytochrome d ubiquinol oxidase subunit II [Nanchangia anserum]MBD3690199.1 cytochrome d ubiquinol oxidase subunit II [Nanchangia anserum]QOX82349.1 cytochrome d ubiquinol oxidase subunit II [Nanchangia anserum]